MQAGLTHRLKGFFSDLVQDAKKASGCAPLTYPSWTPTRARLRRGTAWTPLPAFSADTKRRGTLYLVETRERFRIGYSLDPTASQTRLTASWICGPGLSV